ncbi:MAG: HAD-IIIA family hydrolase [Synechococcaceae cyanobacterium]|nr:HAD-IIIA family hydrolase [Synechococcaceae cyanobacterium]
MVDLFLRQIHLGSVKAVLFDKDGTLSHSEPMLTLLAKARIDAAIELHDPGEGCDLGTVEQLQNLLCQAYGLRSTGLNPGGTIAVAARDHNLLSTATVLAQVGHGWPEALAISEEIFRRTDHLHGRGSQQVPQPTTGLPSLLRSLHSAGIRCAVISNDEASGIHAFLSDHDLAAPFVAIWSADHQPRKPDPAAVHQLCQTMGVEPGDCALIGDANSDLRMADAAGVAVVLGYCGGWSQPVALDPRFPQLRHWQELGVGQAGRDEEGSSPDQKGFP